MSVIMISEDKVETLSEHIEKGLRHLGKAMQCVDEWMHDGYGERDGRMERDVYGERMPRVYGRGYGERDDEEWREERDRMGERERYGERDRMGDYGRGYGQRRTRDARGRYM